MKIYTLVYAFDSVSCEGVTDFLTVENIEVDNTVIGTYASKSLAVEAMKTYAPRYFYSPTMTEESNDARPDICARVCGYVDHCIEACLMVVESELIG